MNNIDDVLELLKKSDEEILKNAESLFNDIKELKSNVESSSELGYKNIDNSLNTLKDFLEEKNYEIENNESLKNKKEFELNELYYQKIVNMKNDLFDYSIKQSDILQDSFNIFSNSKNKIFEEYKNILKSSNTNVNEKFNNISKTIDEYNGFLSKSVNDLESNFNKILVKYSNIFKSISSSFIDDYDKYIKIKNMYDEELNDSLNVIVNNELDDVNLKLDLKSIFDKRLVKLYDYYKTSLNKELQRLDFIYNKTNIELSKHINKLIKKNLDIIKKLEEKEIYELINKDRNISKYVKEININKSINFSEYLYSLIKDAREKEYEDNKKKIFDKYNQILFDTNSKKEIINLLSNENKYYFILQNKDLSEKLLLVYNDTFKDITLRKLNELQKLNNKEIKTICDLYINKNELIYNLNNISNDFKKKLELKTNDLNNRLLLFKNSNINNLNNDLKSIDSINSKNEIFNNKLKLDFECARINTKYLIEKSNLKLAYDLSLIEKDISLVKPNFELKKIFDQYEALKKSYETLYESQKTLLEKSKERYELMDLSNIKYANSLIKNKTLISKQMIELSLKEYELKINVLNSVAESSKKYTKAQIDNINKYYLDRINDLNNLKDIEIKSIIDVLDSNNQIKIEVIKSKYQKLQDDIQKMLDNDENIIFENDNIKILNETINKGFDDASIIKDKEINISNESLVKAKNNFDSILDSLKQTPIDYTSSFDQYEKTYNSIMKRITDKYDNESKEFKDKIYSINNSYNYKYYIDKFKELDDAHEKELNEAIQTYKKDKDIINNNIINDLNTLTDNSLENEIVQKYNKIQNDSYNKLLKDNEVLKDNENLALNKNISLYNQDYQSLLNRLEKVKYYNKNNLKLFKKIIIKTKHKN